MPAQSTINVCPPRLLQAAAAVSAAAAEAARPSPGLIPAVGAGSASDAACATFAAGLTTRTAKLAAKLAGKGPQIELTTEGGAAQLESRDDQNAKQIRAVGQSV